MTELISPPSGLPRNGEALSIRGLPPRHEWTRVPHFSRGGVIFVETQFTHDEVQFLQTGLNVHQRLLNGAYLTGNDTYETNGGSYFPAIPIWSSRTATISFLEVASRAADAVIKDLDGQKNSHRSDQMKELKLDLSEIFALPSQLNLYEYKQE